MSWPIVKFVLGLVLAISTLGDVFDTVVVPGENRGPLTISRRILLATLPVWRWAGRRERIPASFAPVVLAVSFVTWMLLLNLAFGLMAAALPAAFDPALSSLPQALYVTGSGMATLGLSHTEATGPARWIVLAAGFSGLAVMTMSVSYLLAVQGSIAERDAGILKLTTISGQPPSGLAILERCAELNLHDYVPQMLHDGREWCARVRQSHGSHPALIYFRSRGAGTGWPAALGALIDLALTVEFLVEEPQWRGLAVLLREEGECMAETLIKIVGLPFGARPPSADEVELLRSRLAAAGYPLRADTDCAGFIAQRARRVAHVSTMAAHLGVEAAPLVPDVRSRPLMDLDVVGA
jgi:hypothetical protein